MPTMWGNTKHCKEKKIKALKLSGDGYVKTINNSGLDIGNSEFILDFHPLIQHRIKEMLSRGGPLKITIKVLHEDKM